MKCPKCGSRINATHTFSAGPQGSTRRSVCSKCRKTFTIVQAIVAEDPDSGEGAYALAKKMISGELKVGVSSPEPG